MTVPSQKRVNAISLLSQAVPSLSQSSVASDNFGSVSFGIKLTLNRRRRWKVAGSHVTYRRTTRRLLYRSCGNELSNASRDDGKAPELTKWCTFEMLIDRCCRCSRSVRLRSATISITAVYGALTAFLGTSASRVGVGTMNVRCAHTHAPSPGIASSSNVSWPLSGLRPNAICRTAPYLIAKMTVVS